MGTVEALLPTGGYPTAHAPAMVELPDGSLLCCWFAGSYEGSADIHIICSLLPKDAPAWLPPVDISGDPTAANRTPRCSTAPTGRCGAMYTAQLDRQEGKDNMQYTAVVRCQKSCDGGRTWRPYQTVFPEEGTFCRQPIQVLSNGRWIFANWLCTDSADGLSGDPTAFRISDDQGKSWRMVMMPGSNGHVHANVVELEPGHLVAFMRNREAYRIHRSESFDWGESWRRAQAHPAAQQQFQHQRHQAPERTGRHRVQSHLHPRSPPRQGGLARPALPGGGGPERGRRPDLPHHPLDGAGRGLHGG